MTTYRDILDDLEFAAQASEPFRLTPKQVEMTYQALCKLEDLEDTQSALNEFKRGPKG